MKHVADLVNWRGEITIGGSQIVAGAQTQRELPGIFLFFGKGERPSRREVIERLTDGGRVFVSHDPFASAMRNAPQEGEPSAGELSAWLELLCDGLTFDLLGLQDGPGLSPDSVAYRFGCADDVVDGENEAIGLFPGPHLADGANSLPVVRTMVGLALRLAQLGKNVRAFYWSPARALIGPDLFSRVVGEWLEGGAFPALGLVGYTFTESGGMRSDGLAFFADSEIEIHPLLARDRIAATRLAVRVVHLLVGSEPPDRVLRFVFEDRELQLRPDPDRTLIHVELA